MDHCESRFGVSVAPLLGLSILAAYYWLVSCCRRVVEPSDHKKQADQVGVEWYQVQFFPRLQLLHSREQEEGPGDRVFLHERLLVHTNQQGPPAHERGLHPRWEQVQKYLQEEEADQMLSELRLSYKVSFHSCISV